MTDEEIMDVASKWLNPIDSIIADLLDKSQRMTIGAFSREVNLVIESIPQLFDKLSTTELTTELEKQIGDAIIKGLSQ
mgnify:CR=1 FL=1|jgi:hypothetical protein